MPVEHIVYTTSSTVIASNANEIDLSLLNIPDYDKKEQNLKKKLQRIRSLGK